MKKQHMKHKTTTVATSTFHVLDACHFFKFCRRARLVREVKLLGPLSKSIRSIVRSLFTKNNYMNGSEIAR
jgi:hypothetical protein